MPLILTNMGLAVILAATQVLSNPLDPNATGTQQTQQTAAQTAQAAAAAQTATNDNTVARPVDISNDLMRRASARQGLALRDETDEAVRARAQLRRPEQIGEFEAYASEVIGKPIRRFGSNLLVPTARDFTAPPTTTIPPDYRMNPGDEVIVGLTGSVQASDLRLTVDPQGRVFIPRVGAVRIGGVRYGDVQQVLADQIARQYRNFRVSVSIGQLQGITVYVTGFAAQPGSYTISSLSTVVNAVLAAGGPSSAGSFRSIQVRRGGKLVTDFDLYDLLLRGDKSGDAVLQNGDVLYIAPVGAQAAVFGSVNNPAIFEAAPRDKISDILLYAGGVNSVADTTRALVLTPFSGASSGWEELTPAQAAVRAVTRGSIIRVLSGVGLARPTEQQPVLVAISGEVARPGRYYLQPGAHVSDVLAQAGGITGNAFAFGTVFTRVSVQRSQAASYDRALNDLELSLALKPLASTSERDLTNPTAMAEISRTLITQLRARRPDGRMVIDLPSTATTLPGDLTLENDDTIYIPPPPTTVGVFGAVNSPSSFFFQGTGIIRNYVERAGGAQRYGQLSRLIVVRANGLVLSGRSALKTRALPGDLVFVPVNTTRGETWQRIRDIATLLVQAAAPAAVVYSVLK